MKRATRFIFILFFCCGISAGSMAADKKKYDVDGTVPAKTGLGPVSVASSFRGWGNRGTVAEVAVLPGGYFTCGTTGGKSSTPLDKNTSITFGHPYALTSYPVLCVDGIWGNLAHFFNVDTTNASVAGDSILLRYRNAQGLDVRFIARIDNGGSDITFSLLAVNGDTLPHSMGVGFALDPALGPCGDGVLTVNQSPMVRDTVLGAVALQSQEVKIVERSGLRKGMNVILQFPAGVPQSTAVANWSDDVLKSVAPQGSGDGKKLYDLVVRMFWLPTTIGPHDSISGVVRMAVQPPDFGTGIFLRWDLPTFLAMEDGMVFPGTLSTTVTETNLSASSRQPELHCSVPPELTGPSSSVSLTVPGMGTGYSKIALTPNEIYEDRIVELHLSAVENGQTADSLIRRIRIPATPVSDTGLTVTIDSVASGNFPAIALFLTAERSATHQRVFNLAPKNVFLYDTGERVNEFSLARDTSQGSNAVDIVFVLDVTGSMGEEISGVKTNIIEFTDSLAARGVDFRLGMVTFLDIVENTYNFTSDPNLFKQYVSLQNAHAGGDEPENSLDALQRASEFPFRDNAERLFIWITDATYHHENSITPRSAAVIVNRLLSVDVTVYAIGPTYNLNTWYAPIVDPTGGKFFDIGGNFRDILLDISHGRASGRFMLSYQASTSPPGPRQIKTELHLAGLGGFALANYAAPGAGAPFVHALQGYPNPFNPEVTFRVDLHGPARADIAIVNLLGQLVRTFHVTPSDGAIEFTWDGKNTAGRRVASGVYFVRSTVIGPGEKLMGTDVLKLLHLQ